MSNGKSKKTEAPAAATTALTTVGDAEYAILKSSPDSVRELIRANVGPDGISAMDLDRIKIPAGGGQAWAIPTVDGEDVAKEFVGVIIHHKSGRLYWKEKYQGQGQPPDCVSDDGQTGVGDPGGDCARCPLAKFGSDANGGKGQACKQVKMLFVMRPGDLLPVAVSLPPTSLAGARKFLLRLASQALPFYAVAVRFALEKTKNSGGIEYSRVLLSVADRLAPEQASAMKAISEALRPHLDRVRVGAEDYSGGGEETPI